MLKIRVAIVGATGHTGGSAVTGLLDDGKFVVIALVRPQSMEKPVVGDLQRRGVEVREADLEGPEEKLVRALRDIDIVISCVRESTSQQQDQLSLANAAKTAGVKRFVPCGFGVIAPPTGVMRLRELKEVVYNHIKRLSLPYTIVDIGWWYQISFPRLPSGRVDYVAMGVADEILGGGNVPSAITDVRDIGRYLAKIIVDERTLNKMVFAYNTVMSQNQIYDLMEEISHEKLERNYVADDAIYALVSECRLSAVSSSADPTGSYPLMLAEHKLSWGIRGDNNPDYAKYLGYLTSKELYPDFEPTPFSDYLRSVVGGKGEGRTWGLKE